MNSKTWKAMSNDERLKHILAKPSVKSVTICSGEQHQSYKQPSRRDLWRAEVAARKASR